MAKNEQFNFGESQNPDIGRTQIKYPLDPISGSAISKYLEGKNIKLESSQILISRTVTIDQNLDAVSLSIDTEATTANGIDILTPAQTTGNVINITPNALTTGRAISIVSNSSETDNRFLVFIHNDNTLAVGTRPLRVTQDATNAVASFRQNADSTNLDLHSESTGSPSLDFTVTKQTTGEILKIVSADSLTGGRIANFTSNSSTTNGRELIRIVNNNTLATGCVPLFIRQDAAKHAMGIGLGTLDVGFIDFTATADADATSAISTFTTSGAIAGHIQIEINGTSQWLAFLDDPS